MKQVLFFIGDGDEFLEKEINSTTSRIQEKFPSFNIFKVCQSTVHNIEFGNPGVPPKDDFPFYVVVSVWYEVSRDDFEKMKKQEW
jgi:hypothetical protein